MLPTFVDQVLREIVELKNTYPKLTMENHRIHTLERELRFLKLFIWFLPKKSLMKPYMSVAVGIPKPKLKLKFDRAISRLLREVEVCKDKIRGQRLRLLNFSSQYKFSSSSELLRFIRCTIMNLRNLARFNSSAIVSVRVQVKALIKKLRILGDFVNATGKWFYFGVDIQDWSLKVACLSTMYWVDQMEEATATASQMNTVLHDLLPMVKCHSLEVARLCHLKASELLAFDRFQMFKVIENFVDFILPIGFMKVLRLELTFLIAFFMDPPEGEISFAKLGEAFTSEILSLICSVAAGEVNESTVKASNVRDFREKTSKLMTVVRRMLYIHNPNSSRPHFPTTNAFAFFDSLLEKFGKPMDMLISKASYIPFAKDQFLILHEELVSFRPFLKKVEELEEMKDLQMRISDVLYQVEYVIDSCQMTMFPIWYNVICLFSVMEEMKVIKSKNRGIMHKQIHKVEVNNPKVDSYISHIYQGHTAGPDGVVGYKDEEEKIIGRLIARGSKRLGIVSIVGMPGQGKTTLAKKVYNSPRVSHHFTKRSWCFVTQVYSVEKLLMDILKDVGEEAHNLKCDDLAHKVRKCLIGHRYLIILDDIWDISAWNELKESFPDDNNGSRVLFTSRNDFGCNPYLLRPLSDEESVELLKYKLFYKNDWPSNISHFVEKILKICDGLPLALVVVSGLLRGTSGNLSEWGKIIEKINSNIPGEGCMDILELSYKNLPDFLKPCFLYVGAEAKRNKVFTVKKLIQIWISEGFVQKQVHKSLEDVANEYLEDLVRRSLVIVDKRSSTGEGIKECRIHDLLLELCLRKANEERFMLFPDQFYRYSSEVIYDPYRLCISDGKVAGVWLENNGSIVHLTPLMKTTSRIIRSFLLPSSFSTFNPFKSDFYWRLMFVRVLDLGNVHFDEFPLKVVFLIHLRYLSIRCNAEVIPSSIAKLCNLENLHMIGARLCVFPDTIWKMKTLRNISVSGGATILLNDDDANACPKLENLHSFSSLRLSNEEEAKKILSRFPHVRKLKLVFSKSCKCGSGLFQVLHLLRKLEKLRLDHISVANPCPFNLPGTLKKLTLSWFTPKWSKLSTIGKLPNLEVLKLWHSYNGRGRWEVGDEEFLKLKYLKLYNLGITEWEASNSSFPCLEQLVVQYCPLLEELPSIFEDVRTLKMIEIRGCREGVEMSANRILDEQKDMGNEGLIILIVKDTIWNLKTLRNISTSGGATMLLNDDDANAFPELENLHSYSSLCLSNEWDAKKILRRLPHVRKLKLLFSESWECRCGLFQVLHCLRKLEKLNLGYYFGANPCPFNLPGTLKKLTLSRFSHEWSEISAIGKLPNLEVLKLLDSGNRKGRWEVGDEEFLKLKYLRLYRLDITEWEASDSSFPCLEQLVVQYCTLLEGLPSIFEDVVSTLKMIEIGYCSEGVEMSANRIRDEQKDMGNEGLNILIFEDVRFKNLEFPVELGNPISYDETGRIVGMLKALIPVQSEVKLGDKKGSWELGLEKKKDFRTRHVQTARRIKILTKKHNYQPRQAIMSRQHKEVMKRDG